MIRTPSFIIKIDKNTNKIDTPTLLLLNQAGDKILGKISKYTNWNINLIGNGLDEISFDVHKYNDNIENPIWNDIIDLKTVLIPNFGQFEIDVNYTDNTETVKSVHGVSKENELGQLYLYDFHVNDEEATTMEITEYNQDDFDEHGNFIPTVFYDEDDPTHSLLHRILKDKAPHWSLGYITPYIALNEEDDAELSNKFQRAYTADGDSIYDFLTGTVAEESNVIFIFDTINRVINCYSLCDCYITENEAKTLVENAIGEDTTILVSKNKIANEITISSNKDSIKNCFRIEGGDDVITDYVRAANINGSNYIYRFADFQLNDMPSELKQKILDYQELIEANKSAYIGENGIFTRLCSAYDDLAYYTSEMMPNVTLEPTTAEEQYDNVRQELQLINVGVSKLSIYDSTSFQSVTNNVLAMAQVFLDSRYNIEVIDDYTTYDGITHIWSGNFRIVRASDETDYYPKTEMDKSDVIGVQIDDDETLFVKQKLLKALSKTDMTEIDFFVEEIWEDSQLTDEEKRQEIYDYFDEYALNRLTSFQKGYASCIGLLTQVGHVTTGLTEDGVETASTVRDELYDKYKTYQDIVNEVLEKRQGQVDNINDEITNLKEEQLAFQESMNFPNYLGEELYHTFLKYCREDTYSNDNFISEGLSDAEILQKAQELIDAANKEIGKACVLQRTVSTSLNNLLLLPEFEPLYENFSLFNYIRVKTEDEIIKLRLLEISFLGESASEIDVTFSEQIESVDGNLSDLQSILQQASSIASSYSSTTLQAKQGSKANSQWQDVYENGLNTARTVIKNSDNNEVTITEAGIYCKRMDDEGLYGNKQLAIVGNMIAFTKNNWQSVELAIGETEITNPVTSITEKKYGVVADAIVGKLLVGESLHIGNSDGSIQMTGSGIVIKNHQNNEDVFKVDNNGNAFFRGTITGSSGEFTEGFNVNIEGTLEGDPDDPSDDDKRIRHIFNVADDLLRISYEEQEQYTDWHGEIAYRWVDSCFMSMGQGGFNLWCDDSVSLQAESEIDLTLTGNPVIQMFSVPSRIVRVYEKTIFSKNVDISGNITANNYQDSSWVNMQFSSSFDNYNNNTNFCPQYRRVGNVVYIRGVATPHVDITGSGTKYTLFTLPEGYRPTREISTLCQGSGNHKWLLSISTEGVVSFSRYNNGYNNNGQTYQTVTVGNWLPFDFTFITD